MKRLYKSAALLATLAATLTAGLAAHRLFFKPHFWLTTSSPHRTYTVGLTGDKGRGGFIFDSRVYFSAYRDGRAVAQDVIIHAGDWLDSSFELDYPEHAWVAENALRFWRHPHLPGEKGPPDTLLLSNEAAEPIKYLILKSRDLFLVFDVQPHSALRFSTTPESSGAYVSVVAVFEGGKRLDYGANFPRPAKTGGPVRYCVLVGPDLIRAGSPEVEGYDLQGRGDRPNIPRSPSCQP